MGFETGDPIIQHYFRLNDLLYRSSAVYSDGMTFISMIERRFMDVWEPVLGTVVEHPNEKKALNRAKKLVDPLEHAPLIYLAYWSPPEEKETLPEEAIYIRVSPGPGNYLFSIGDYLIKPDGPRFALHIWDGFNANSVGQSFLTLEAATIAAVIKSRKDLKDKAEKAKPVVKEVPVSDEPVDIEQLEITLRRQIDDVMKNPNISDVVRGRIDDDLPDDVDIDHTWGYPPDRD